MSWSQILEGHMQVPLVISLQTVHVISRLPSDLSLQIRAMLSFNQVQGLSWTPFLKRNGQKLNKRPTHCFLLLRNRKQLANPKQQILRACFLWDTIPAKTDDYLSPWPVSHIGLNDYYGILLVIWRPSAFQ